MLQIWTRRASTSQILIAGPKYTGPVLWQCKFTSGTPVPKLASFSHELLRAWSLQRDITHEPVAFVGGGLELGHSRHRTPGKKHRRKYDGDGNMRVFLYGPRDIKEYQKGCVALSASSWMNFLISRSCSHEVGKGGRGSEGGISRWDGNINTGLGLAGWSERRMTEE